MNDEYTENDTNEIFEGLDAALRHAKPCDRTPEDRHYAIVITELSKLYAYWYTYIAKDVTRAL